MELPSVMPPPGKGTIKFPAEPLHPDSGPPETQLLWISSFHHLGHAGHADLNDGHRIEVCMKHFAFDSVTTLDGDKYVSTTTTLQLGTTRFTLGESFSCFKTRFVLIFESSQVRRFYRTVSLKPECISVQDPMQRLWERHPWFDCVLYRRARSHPAMGANENIHLRPSTFLSCFGTVLPCCREVLVEKYAAEPVVSQS
jgi:hypothetical protein